MSTPPSPKSTVEEIRDRFDHDVERFSNLQTGQSATIDAPLILDLISAAAATVTPHAQHLLDVGCGAGNYTLKVLERFSASSHSGKRSTLNISLLDLSQPMLERARQRITPHTSGTVTTLQQDIRVAEFPDHSVDIILAAAVLHHLRSDDEWLSVFVKFHRILRPGGSLWISDLITHTSPPIQILMWQRYGEYLTQLKSAAYRDEVFAYIDHEDTPRPLLYQVDLLRQVGFTEIDILHKNSVGAAFGARKT